MIRNATPKDLLSLSHLFYICFKPEYKKVNWILKLHEVKDIISFYLKNTDLFLVLEKNKTIIGFAVAARSIAHLKKRLPKYLLQWQKNALLNRYNEGFGYNILCIYKRLIHIIPAFSIKRPFFLTIAIHPKEQNKGAAKKLLYYGIAELKDMGYKEIYFQITEKSFQSLALTKTFGLEPIATRTINAIKVNLYKKEL